MASLIPQRSLAPFPFLFFLFTAALLWGEVTGRDLYMKNCASCHGKDRLGYNAPPLLPERINSLGEERVKEIIIKGIPYSGMPPFPRLKSFEVERILYYLKSPPKAVSYGINDIKKSREIYPVRRQIPKVSDPSRLVVLVERKRGKILVLEGGSLLDSFSAGRVHGGIKFTADIGRFFVPARDGWIYLYDLSEMRLEGRVKACVYLRNIALSDNGAFLGALCSLPPAFVVFDRDLNPLVLTYLKGRPSAVAYLKKKEGFLVAFRDRPEVAVISPEGELKEFRLQGPVDSFFIDPLGEYLIASHGDRLVVYSVDGFESMFVESVPSPPHLFSADFWYRKGSFYFATTHRGTDRVSVWRMYRWKKVRELKTGVKGVFVRTAPFSRYLWVDGGEGFYLLIDRESFEVKKLRVGTGVRTTHVEFSPDRLAYISAVGKVGGLFIFNASTLERIRKISLPHPAGKYSPLFKVSALRSYLLGKEVYREYCWGCHNLRKRAFGPSFEQIARTRNEKSILRALKSPPTPYMPSFSLSRAEKEALLSLFRFLKKGEVHAEGK